MSLYGAFPNMFTKGTMRLCWSRVAFAAACASGPLPVAAAEVRAFSSLSSLRAAAIGRA